MKILSRLFLASACFVMSCVTGYAAVKNHNLSSPDERLAVTVLSGENLCWSLAYDGKLLIAPGLSYRRLGYVGMDDSGKIEA